MQLETWVPPCVLFGQWFSPWKLWGYWLVHIIVPSLGVLSLSSLYSAQYLAQIEQFTGGKVCLPPTELLCFFPGNHKFLSWIKYDYPSSKPKSISHILKEVCWYHSCNYSVPRTSPFGKGFKDRQALTSQLETILLSFITTKC